MSISGATPEIPTEERCAKAQGGKSSDGKKN